MPDQTPVTDDDRKEVALPKCTRVQIVTDNGDNEDAWNAYKHGARLLIQDDGRTAKIVPAPPATLADELREWGCRRPAPDEVDWKAFGALADRAETVEKERDAADSALSRLIVENRDLTDERDEARAELGQLTVDWKSPEPLTASRIKEYIERLNAEQYGSTSRELPDPADVPEGEAWIAEVRGERRIGFRCDPDSTEPWYFPPIDRPVLLAGDQDTTLIARLVPETRRVIDRPEDLDALPVGSIVLDDDGDPCRMTGKFVTGGECFWIKGTTNYGSKALIDRCGTVAVIHEPEATA